MSTGYLSLPTKQKIFVARIISRALRYSSKILGHNGIIQTKRRGDILWHLDINDGLDLAIFLNVYEPLTSKVLIQTTNLNDTVMDIGANNGAHTLPLAKKVGPMGKVIAVEATNSAVRRLQKNIQLNPDLAERIHVIHAMLGEPNQILPGAIPSSWPLNTQEPTLDPDFLGKPQSTETARMQTLDELVNELNIPKLDLVKLDVDGYEFGVLAGGRQTLKNLRPIILMEVAPYLHDRKDYSFDGLLSLIHSLSYSAFDLDTNTCLALKRSSFPKKTGESVDILLRPSN